MTRMRRIYTDTISDDQLNPRHQRSILANSGQNDEV